MGTEKESFKQRIDYWVHRVVQPRQYFCAALFISWDGFLNGFDTGCIGAITEMGTFQSEIGVLTPTMRGPTVSLLLLAGAPASLFAGVLADKFGHLSITFVGAVIFTIGAALESAAVNLAILLVGRSLVDVGKGLYLGNMNVYICEIAPKARRGTLMAMPQLLVTAGVCVGYFTCYATIHIQSQWQWRLPFIVQVAGGAILALACLLLPASPRWLLLNDKPQIAMRNLKKLDLTEDELLINSDVPLDNTEGVNPGRPQPQTSLSWRAVSDLFRKEYRFRTTLALFILGMVQLRGIDGVLYYAPTLFAQAGLPDSTASFLASGVSAIFMFLISIPAFLTVDKFGRRTIVIWGGLLLMFCMLVIGCLYASNNVIRGKGAGRWVVIVLIFVFALAYVSTWGIVGKIYASEIQPAHNRATANALAQALNFYTNFLTAFITPIFLARFSSGPYFLFAALTAVTLVVLWLWMPETKLRSLESIQEVFMSPIQEKLSTVRFRQQVGRSEA